MADRDLWVDFNEADAHQRVTTLARFATDRGSMFLGQHLLVGDDEGNRCEAVVVALEDELVELELDPKTFHPAGSIF